MITERCQMDIPNEKASFPFVLDHKPGFLLGWFLYRLFRRAGFDEHMTERLRQMNREGTVVYAIKYRGKLDYLLYHYRFRRARIPYPKDEDRDKQPPRGPKSQPAGARQAGPAADEKSGSYA